jgi:hypothetical protein
VFQTSAPPRRPGSPDVPGAPGSGTPTIEEPVAPHDPLPPKHEQGTPDTRTPTGAETGVPPATNGQQGAYLTTAQGARLRDTDHSLKAGPRGPILLQDHHRREKITHFDHERIPERVVHARGAGAHGIFEGYGTADAVTRAAFLRMRPDIHRRRMRRPRGARRGRRLLPRIAANPDQGLTDGDSHSVTSWVSPSRNWNQPRTAFRCTRCLHGRGRATMPS